MQTKAILGKKNQSEIFFNIKLVLAFLVGKITTVKM